MTTRKKTAAPAPEPFPHTKENLVGLWVNLSRAYEIAKLGGFSIQIVADLKYTQASKDYPLIKDFYLDVPFLASGDLIIDISQPDYFQRGTYETMSDIHARVLKAQNNERPSVMGITNESCKALLKTATERLSFSLPEIQMVKQIACVIAQLDNSRSVEAQHMAEAIQYRAFLPEEGVVIAENSKIVFGKHIQMDNVEFDAFDAKNAINHLFKFAYNGLEQLLNDYQRKLESINEMIENHKEDKSNCPDDPNLIRLTTKKSCYQSMIVDIEREIARQKG